MRQISISQLSTLRWSFYQDVIQYSHYGFESVGIWRQKFNDLDFDEASDLLFEMKLSVSSVHWAGAFTGSDGKSHSQAIVDGVEAIQLASRLNANCLIVHSGSRNGHTSSHAYRLFLTALQAMVPVAFDYGVKLAIEPMPGSRSRAWTFLETLEDSIQLLNEFSHESLGMVLDLYHVGLDANVFENLKPLMPYVALVQLANRPAGAADQELRIPLDKGVVPVENWLRRLQELGYAGSYEVELHGPGMQSLDYHAMLKSTQQFLQQESIQSLLAIRTEDIEPAHVKRSPHRS